MSDVCILPCSNQAGKYKHINMGISYFSYDLNLLNFFCNKLSIVFWSGAIQFSLVVSFNTYKLTLLKAAERQKKQKT